MSEGELAAFVSIINKYHSKREEASSLADQAVKQYPDRLLFQYVKRFLESDGSVKALYQSADAFAWFIRGFENPEVYDAQRNQFSEVYKSKQNSNEFLRILDIGPGTGMGLLPALQQHLSDDQAKCEVHLVEPSEDMLKQLLTKITDIQSAVTSDRLQYHSSVIPIQQYIQNEQQSSNEWDIVQTTFVMHNIPPDERKKVWEYVHARTKTLLLVEFDISAENGTVKKCGELIVDENYARIVFTKYDDMLRKYHHDGRFSEQSDEFTVEQLSDAVIMKFLMPIMFGYFERTETAKNAVFEQPISCWREELLGAGFSSVNRALVFGYWWGDCFVLRAEK